MNTSAIAVQSSHVHRQLEQTKRNLAAELKKANRDSPYPTSIYRNAHQSRQSGDIQLAPHGCRVIIDNGKSMVDIDKLHNILMERFRHLRRVGNITFCVYAILTTVGGTDIIGGMRPESRNVEHLVKLFTDPTSGFVPLLQAFGICDIGNITKTCTKLPGTNTYLPPTRRSLRFCTSCSCYCMLLSPT